MYYIERSVRPSMRKTAERTPKNPLRGKVLKPGMKKRLEELIREYSQSAIEFEGCLGSKAAFYWLDTDRPAPYDVAPKQSVSY